MAGYCRLQAVVLRFGHFPLLLNVLFQLRTKVVLCVFAILMGAACSRGEDDIAEAMEAVNRQLQATPNNPQLLLQRAHLLTLGKKFDQALSDMDQAHRITPLPEIEREKARVYFAAGWYETGLEHANRHVQKFPNDPDGYMWRGRLNAQLGRVVEAGADLGTAIQQRAQPTLEMYMERAQILTTEDGAYLNEALSTLNDGIKRIGSVVTLEGAALEVELRQQNYDGALARVNRLVEKMPRKDNWLARKGDVLVQAGRLEEARVAYQEALDVIAKLPQRQRVQPSTQNLENQLKTLLATTTDLAGQAALPRQTNLLTRQASEPPPLVAPSFTNEPALPPGGKVRSYFIAAEEVDWNYAPAGNVLQEPFCGDPDAVPGAAIPGRIGTTYKKAIYREYTDGTFQRLTIRSGDWRHLGILGPLIRAEVGDRIRITLKNKTRIHVSLHPHGVFYLKSSEGSGYNDDTGPSDKKDDAVSPGQTFVYEWTVPERAGPGPNDPSSLVWLYHSHVHAPMDSNAGLIGAIIVTAKGKALPDGAPKDVDREFVTLFNIFNENQSWYFNLNLKTYLDPKIKVDTNDLLFIESNMKHTINGFIFANMPLMTSRQGERVRWYLLGMGSEADLHTAHWHGNTVLWRGYRTDVVELLPASMKVADMIADNPGTWMYHCHVNDHMLEGMSARYQVVPPQGPPATTSLSPPQRAASVPPPRPAAVPVSQEPRP
jgi:tetratricopeptide (TPR) repeat protein